jgi:glycosyltransferase involved in cell wall biosynthesis
MKSHKISIVTPNYNLGEYLEQTIESILSQEYPNLEYIIVDGGSTDNSVDIIKKYEKHLTWWVSEPDNGMYNAINKGFSRSTGEIMGWLNSDDCLYPKALSTINKLFSELPSVKWLTGAGSIIDEEGLVVKVDAAQKWSKYLYYLGKYGFIQQESTFWRKSLWEQAGREMNVDLKLAGDMELWSRFFKYEKLHSVPVPLGCFRKRKVGNAAYSNFDEYISECNSVIQKTIPSLTHDELRRLKNLKKKYAILGLLEKLRIFNHKGYKKYFIDPLLEFPKEVSFNRYSQKFELKA